MRRIHNQLVSFFFRAESDRWLSVLRIGIGIQILFYTWSSRADWNALFAKSGGGLVNRELTEAVLSVESPFVPQLGWLIHVGALLGVSEANVLWSAWAILLCAGGCLVLGLFCRPSAILAWFVHLCAVKSEDLLSYGMDNFTTIGAFYLMLSPLPDRLSMDYLLRAPDNSPTAHNGLIRHVLQLHVCIIYFFGGIMKSIGTEWWNGNSVWRALTSPPYNVVAPQVLIVWKNLLPILGITVCLLETTYPFLIWLRRTRLVFLGAICTMHLVIGSTMGLYLFSLIMITLNLAAFGPGFSFMLPEEKATQPDSVAPS